MFKTSFDDSLPLRAGLETLLATWRETKTLPKLPAVQEHSEQQMCFSWICLQVSVSSSHECPLSLVATALLLKLLYY